MIYLDDTEKAQLVTTAARNQLNTLQKAGYLHSHYERFQEIADYKTVYRRNLLSRIGKQVIQAQQARERAIFSQLAKVGIKNVKDLNEFVFGDQLMKQFAERQFDNIYHVLASALKDTTGSGKLDRQFDISQMENQLQTNLQSFMDKSVGGFKEELERKGITSGKFSQELINVLQRTSKYDNKTNELKTANQFATSAFSQWKGAAFEQCLAVVMGKIANVTNAEVVGSDLDIMGKFEKSDVNFSLGEINVGLSAKDYKLLLNKDKEIELPNELTLHSRSSFENFLKRLENLQFPEGQAALDKVVAGFRSNNFYYHLINEAAQGTQFKSSSPAQDFIQTVKDLAGAWFGSQLVVAGKEATAGQNVDFFVIKGIGFIPMSQLLITLASEDNMANLNVAIGLNSQKLSGYKPYDYLHKKVSSGPSTSLYQSPEVAIGKEEGEIIYDAIQVGDIRLKVIAEQLRREVN